MTPINHDFWESLNGQVVDDDIKKALFDMAPWKVPGPDDFPSGFFQHFWDIMGNNIISLVQWDGYLPFNETCITLLPKKKNLTMSADWRPISLSNTIYEIISKVICNRLKPIMPHILHVNQGVFIMGRGPVDNAYIVHEIIHSILTRDLSLFNKAMIAKTGWKIVFKSESFLASILK